MAANYFLEPEVEFLGGLLEGLVIDSNLTEISTCVTDAQSVVD